MEFQVRYLALFLLFSVIDFSVILHKNIHLILEFLKVPSMVLLYINDLADDFICDIAVYADDTTLYSKFDQASDLWQQLDFASELESDIRDTWLGQKVACWFQCWKNWFRLNGLITLVLLMWK